MTHTDSTDSTKSSQLSDCDPNLDKTSKSSIIWIKLKDENMLSKV